MFSPVSAIVELCVADHLSRKYGQCIFHPVGYFPAHDGTALHGWPEIRFEVKLDAKARETGNMAFEKSCSGVTSGICRTSAYTLFQCVPDAYGTLVVYEFAVSELRDALQNYPTKWGGDDNESELAIIPIDKAARLAVGTFRLDIPWSSFRPYW